MSFIAGIVDFEGAIDPSAKTAFFDAFSSFPPFPSPEFLEGETFLFGRAGFPHMWEGPKLLSKGRRPAVSAGVQWRRLPGSAASALAYLTTVLTSTGCEIGNYFDFFNCAVVDEEAAAAVLAVDPVGVYPLFYAYEGGRLLFSSRQTVLKALLGNRWHVNWQAVSEYLVVGHSLGEKTLIEEIRALPAGCRLICRRGKIEVSKYGPLRPPRIGGVEEAETAVEALFDHLLRKCAAYAELRQRPTAGLLSGGWDSRLLVSLFARFGGLETTYTTQQRTTFRGRILSEKKIAKEVARFLGAPNRFVKPIYRNGRTRSIRARILDYETWFHDWAFTLAEEIPPDAYLFPDGLLGDVLLRGLHITPDLAQGLEREDREGAATILHGRYLKGFNAYTRGAEQWGEVVQPDLMKAFSRGLMEEIDSQLRAIPEGDFVTAFLMNNRTRRGISPLPRHIFGTKGVVLLPFCDQDLVEQCLSIPLKIRLDGSLYKGLLEKSKRGLSHIASTNSSDPHLLEPYLVASVSELSSDDPVEDRSAYPIRSDARVEAFNEASAAQSIAFLADALRPEFKKRIASGKAEALRPFRFYLERFLMLESYFS